MPRTDDSEAVRQGRGRECATRDRNERGVLLGTIWGAILLLLLGGFRKPPARRPASALS